MRNKLLICSTLALSLAVVVFAPRPFQSKLDVRPEHFERLQPGMTRAAVERLLDGPPRNGLRYGAIVWLPQAAGRPISAEIAPDSPAFEFLVRESKPKNARPPGRPASLDFFPQETGRDGHQAVWVTRARLVAVYFGPDGRLRHKYTSTVDESVPPSVIDWLASRPQMIRRSLGF
jgi:hypothetical protein